MTDDSFKNTPPTHSLYGIDFDTAKTQIISGNLEALKKHLCCSNVECINKLKDEYQNNLLHIALLFTTVNKENIINYLVRIGVNKDHKNKGGTTPYELALTTHDKSIIEIFSFSYKSGLESESKALKDSLLKKDTIMRTMDSEIYSLKNTIMTKGKIIGKLSHETSSLKSALDRIQQSYSVLASEKDDLKRTVTTLQQTVSEQITTINTLKRQTTSLTSSNKRLMDENDLLSCQNKKLKMSVDNLISSKRR
jgi:chromosome segregation ATPase